MVRFGIQSQQEGMCDIVETFKKIVIENLDGGITMITINDKRLVDEKDVEELGEELFSVARMRGKNKILLNWKNVEFCSSFFLGKLFKLNRIIQAGRGKLVFCLVPGEIWEVFKATSLNVIFDVRKTQLDGILAFEG